MKKCFFIVSIFLSSHLYSQNITLQAYRGGFGESLELQYEKKLKNSSFSLLTGYKYTFYDAILGNRKFYYYKNSYLNQYAYEIYRFCPQKFLDFFNSSIGLRYNFPKLPHLFLEAKIRVGFTSIHSQIRAISADTVSINAGSYGFVPPDTSKYPYFYFNTSEKNYVLHQKLFFESFLVAGTKIFFTKRLDGILWAGITSAFFDDREWDGDLLLRPIFFTFGIGLNYKSKLKEN